MIKQKLGDKYFGILYSRQGFYTTFLKQYWEAEKYLMLQSRAKDAKAGGSLLTTVCLAYLRHMMALRLDALSQFDEYHKAKCEGAQNERYELLQTRKNKELYTRAGEFRTELARITLENSQLLSQFNKMKEDRDKANDEV